ncbi:hypothetical protein ABTX81_30290 [Kitasatospora sp. NPDC097605]|uniref:hypothetical protein n=1 Tax=Kitasatospora sp. NPDC097605 TaxID=3157226 RepID=UPI00332519AD
MRRTHTHTLTVLALAIALAYAVHQLRLARRAAAAAGVDAVVARFEADLTAQHFRTARRPGAGPEKGDLP